MKNWMQRGKRYLAFLLAALLVYGGVRDVALTAAAGSGGMDERITVTGGDERPDVGTSDAVRKDASGGQTGGADFEGFVSQVELPDNDELFAGYVEQLFYGVDSDISFFGNVGGNALTGDGKTMYDALKAAIEKIASGQETSAQNIKVTGLTGDSGALQATAREVINYLLMDCPYDFYWFDKTVGWSIGLAGSDGSWTMSFNLAVAQGYQGGDAYTVNNAKVVAARAAAQKAQEIVKKYQGKSDYEKLVAYCQEICALVEYDLSAATTPTPYGDPWQLIYVFDDNSGTNVVCEGYSKAFQYLCDLSTFSAGTACYTVTGTMNGGTGEGGHMWNIVTLGGKNYLVDVTNCDEGTIGAPDELFLVGTPVGNVTDGYTFTCKGQNISFKYDTAATGSDLAGLLGGEVLVLASSRYEQEASVELDITAPAVPHVTFGDELDRRILNDGAVTAGSVVVKGTATKVSGTFKWADSVKTYGEAGTKALDAVFVPDDTAAYGSAHNIKVSVTVDKKAVTVTPGNPTKVYGQADPELTYTASGVVAGYPLSGALSRDAGEDAGVYNITLGTLTAEKNPNYDITLDGAAKLTITPAQCTAEVTAAQTVLQGVGLITEPEFTGVKNEKVEGTLTYSYGDLTGGTYAQLTDKLKALSLDTEGEIDYSFAPAGGNYQGPVTGKISFTVKDIEFVAGASPAAVGNGVTVKANPVYGDSWTEIVVIAGITARAGNGEDSDPSHFTLDVTGSPNAGNDLPFIVRYNGTVGGKRYENVTVCGGTVNVARRSVTVTAGTYQVTKEYDGTTSAGAASGALSVSGILPGDTGVSVSAAPVAYTDPNVGGQAQMTLPLTLSGTGAENYTLASTDVAVPCAIAPKTITPTAEVAGAYSYTGSAIVPDVTVKNGSEVLDAANYELTASDNVNAGTAKVTVSPKAGGNYTWSPVETSFVISRVSYPGARTAATAARYGNAGVYDLAALLPEGYRLGAVTVTDGDGIMDGAPSLSGTMLSYKLVNDKTKVGKTAVITVPVTETLNYHGFDLTITVTVSDKLEQTGFGFRESASRKVYGDADFMAAVVNAAPGSSLTFTSSNPAVATVDAAGRVHILKAGSTVIAVNASETADYMAASAVCELTVAPRALTWDVSGLSAVDREGAVVNGKASLYGELKVAGILESDKAEAVFSCPAKLLTGTYANVAAGAQNVTLAWKDGGKTAELLGARAENYTLPAALPSITGSINAVKGEMAPIPESTTALKYSVTMEYGISQVPQAFENAASLNTPAKIAEQMTLNVQTVQTVLGQLISIPRENTAVYDVSLFVSVNGGDWQPAAKQNFPAKGLTVTLPYPAGTGQDSHDFVVCHLFTENVNGHNAGETEYPAVTKTAEGISFKVNGLSPVSVAWTAAGTLGNARAEEDEDEDDIAVSAPPAASGVKSPKTEDRSLTVWPVGAVVLSLGLTAYAWRKRRTR